MFFTSSLLHCTAAFLPAASARLLGARGRSAVSDTNGRDRDRLSLRGENKADKGPGCRKHKRKSGPEEQKRMKRRTERIIADGETKLSASSEVRAAFVLYIQAVCYPHIIS